MAFYKCGGGSVSEDNYMLSGNENKYMFLGTEGIRYANAGRGSSAKVRKRRGESFIWIPKYSTDNARIGTVIVNNSAPTATLAKMTQAGFAYAVSFGYATLDNGKIKFNYSSGGLLNTSMNFPVSSDTIFSYLTFSYFPNDDYESSDATNELFFEIDGCIDIYVA